MPRTHILSMILIPPLLVMTEERMRYRVLILYGPRQHRGLGAGACL